MALNLHTMAGIEKDTHNAFGMTNLGMMLENGRGTEKDVGQAVELYRKAVGPNHSTEMVALGWLYGNGKAVKRDPARRRLYRQSAELGEPQGMHNLAGFLAAGRGSASTPRRRRTGRSRR